MTHKVEGKRFDDVKLGFTSMDVLKLGFERRTGTEQEKENTDLSFVPQKTR